LLLFFLLPACERGCARDWLVRQGVVEGTPSTTAARSASASPLGANDCPDGLARCRDGVVEVSELAVIPQPCNLPPPRCSCPWRAAAACETFCVADGAEVVVEATLAARQLCAPSQDAGAVMQVTPVVGAPTAVGRTPEGRNGRNETVGRTPEGRNGRNETVGRIGCADGQLYRCSGRDVVSCRENAIIGTCIRGCFADDAYLEDDSVLGREAAFAILCSR
jgi:hypothetical protein